MRLRLATRLTVVFVLLALGGAGIGGVLFARQLLLGLDNGLDVGLRARAQTLTPELVTGNAVEPTKLGLVSDSVGITQVLGADGRLLATSAGAGAAPLLKQDQLAKARSGTYILDAERDIPAVAGSERGDTNLRLLGAPLDQAGDVLVVASPHDTVDDAVKRTTVELLVIGIVGITLAGVAARFLIRAALRPVDQARLEAERASETDISELAVPPGDDEFSRLVTTFNDLLGRQRALLEQERTFTADAGHELRTPLAILAAELELAARPGRSADELREALLVAQDETDRLVRLTENLLLLARGDNNTLVHLQPSDLAAVVRESVAGLAPVAERAGVRVELTAPPSLMVAIDPDRMRLAVDNLLRNALRHAPAGTSVEVQLEEGWRLAVRDHGPGFEAEFLPQAFERFTRGSASRTRTGEESGSGLGLAIVRSIVQAHGGEVFAANNATGGATVGFGS